MPVYLATSILGNANNLVTVGESGEIMAWFYPHKDDAQHINACLPCVYLGHGGRGKSTFTFESDWQRHQAYIGDSNALQTTLQGFGWKITFQDAMSDDLNVLTRRITVENVGGNEINGGVYLLGDWKMGGHREGNGLRYDGELKMLLQNHRAATLALGGDALDGWQCGKAGANWSNNARYALEKGVLDGNQLEIGDVNFAAGFYLELSPGETMARTLFLALGEDEKSAVEALKTAQKRGFEAMLKARETSDAQTLARGNEKLEKSGALPADLISAFKRSLLALPLLCGEEGAAVAAPEFDPEFISCGGYGYHWPRDGGEFVSGLLDAGYDEFADGFFDWCARHQDESGLWHQRYFLNGIPAPNWCLPPDALQIDQVGAVGWAMGKKLALQPHWKPSQTQKTMLQKAADYLISRQDSRTGVHQNAFDTWETFIGSFTYSNAAIYACFMAAFEICGDQKYLQAAQKTKSGVLEHFTRDNGHYRYLVRGFHADGSADNVVDSASLGAIEPFGLLDLSVDSELELALGTLRAVTERLETDWMGARAIRRFEGDNYVGGVPACVNTLWMARCCLHVAQELQKRGRNAEADALIERAQSFLQVVLKRATPTLLLPELMQGPDGQKFWAAPHGWAMSSFVSGVLKLASLKKV